jgi:hypothetical protein
MVLHEKPRLKHPKDHPLYGVWRGMRERCSYPGHIRYHRYGGRGIKVCDRWREDFWAFVDDMSPRPEGTTIDRIDNDGDYEPGNCRWATTGEQRRNARRVVMVTHRGKTQCVDDWAAEIGVHRTTLRSRAEVRDWNYPAAIDSFGHDTKDIG